MALPQVKPGTKYPANTLSNTLSLMSSTTKPGQVTATSTNATRSLMPTSTTNNAQAQAAQQVLNHFYGHSNDIRMAQQAGVQGVFHDITKYGDGSKYKDLLHAFKTGGNPIILGGAGVSDGLYKQLQGAGANITRISGADRFDVNNNLKSWIQKNNPSAMKTSDLKNYFGVTSDINMAKQKGIDGNFIDITNWDTLKLLEALVSKGGTVIGGAGATGGIDANEYARAIQEGANIMRIDGKDRYDVQENLVQHLRDLENKKYMDQANSSYEEAMGEMDWIKEMIKKPFEYNPENDAVYQTAKILAEKQAQGASKDAMETMNDRGILNSSMTANQLAQIEQGAQQGVISLIPELANQARGDRQAQIGNMTNLVDQLIGAANNNRDFAEERFGSDRDFNEDQRQFDTNMQHLKNQLAMEKEQFNKNYGLDKAKLDFDKLQADLDNSLKSRGLDLESARLNLSRSEFETEKEYKEHLKKLGISEQNGKIATNGYMSSILGKKSLADALDYIATHSETIANDGADVGAILDAVDAKWGAQSSDVLKDQLNFR